MSSLLVQHLFSAQSPRRAPLASRTSRERQRRATSNLAAGRAVPTRTPGTGGARPSRASHAADARSGGTTTCAGCPSWYAPYITARARPRPCRRRAGSTDHDSNGYVMSCLRLSSRIARDLLLGGRDVLVECRAEVTLSASEALGPDFEPRAIPLTHIHLDHAAADREAGRRWPGVEVHVHERGAPT